MKTSDHQSEGRLRLTKDHEVTPKVKECRTMKDNEGDEPHLKSRCVRTVGVD